MMPLLLAGFGAWCLTGCTPPGPRALLEGEKLLLAGDYAQAVERLQTATELLPNNGQAWNHLGLAYHEAGQFDNAIKAYQQALAPGRNLAIAHYNLGSLYFEQNNYAAAVDELRAYTVLQPQQLAAWNKLGAAQLRLRQYDAAEKTYRYIASVAPNAPEAWNALGMIQLHQRNRARESVPFFNHALQQQPNYPPALFNLALASHYYLNNRPFALQKYREYLALMPRPENWQTAQDLAKQLDLDLNPPPKPATNMVAVVPPTVTNPPTTPTNALPPRSVVTNLPAATNGAKAAPTDLAHSNITVIPKAAVTNQVKAATPPPMKEPVAEVTRVPDPLPAKPAQDTPPAPKTNAPVTTAPPPTVVPPKTVVVTPPLVATAPTAPENTNKPGFFQRINPANLFKKGTKKPAPPTPLNNAPVNITNPPAETPGKLANVTPLPRPAAAGRRYTYHSLIRPAPGNRTAAEPLFDQGLRAHRKGQLTEAIAAYQKALQQDPAYFEAQHNLALALSGNGEPATALTAFELALAMQPASNIARYNFASALKDGEYFQDAVNELEKVLEKYPAEVNAHLLLANLYAQQFGQIALAREHYQKVLQLDPRHPKAVDIRYWLAANP